MLLTRSPLIHPASWASAFDLHVLSTPPAFVLSQDQTLRTKTKTLKPRKTNQKTRSAIPTKNTQKQKTGIQQKQTNTLSSSQTTPTHPRQPNHKAQPPTAVNHHHKPTGPRRQLNNLPTPTPKVKPKQRDPQHIPHKPNKHNENSASTARPSPGLGNDSAGPTAPHQRDWTRKRSEMPLSSHPCRAEPGCPRSEGRAPRGARPWRRRGQHAYRRRRG